MDAANPIAAAVFKAVAGVGRQPPLDLACDFLDPSAGKPASVRQDLAEPEAEVGVADLPVGAGLALSAWLERLHLQDVAERLETLEVLVHELRSRLEATADLGRCRVAGRDCLERAEVRARVTDLVLLANQV